jgi:hypothetical protein
MNEGDATILAHNILTWNKVVLLKVLLFARHFLANRSPTRDDILKRDIMNFDSQNCTLGCGFNETPKHIFFECD